MFIARCHKHKNKVFFLKIWFAKKLGQNRKRTFRFVFKLCNKDKKNRYEIKNERRSQI